MEAYPPNDAGDPLGSAHADAERTYAAAGVSLATADAVVTRLRAAVESTRTDGVVGAFGAFAGLFALDERRLLAASTDSVGSKLVLGRRAGKLRWCGADLAAHGINDVLTTGAEPLFFLDYVAAKRDRPRAGRRARRGRGRRLPRGRLRDPRRRDRRAAGHLPRGRDRLLRHRRRRSSTATELIDGSRVAAGDVVVGLASAGIHANGFSLVRAHRRRRAVRRRPPAAADAAATSTTCARSARAPTCARSPTSRAAGIAGNLARVLPDGRRGGRRPRRLGAAARLRLARRRTGVPEDELRRVFNLGIGYCAVVPAADVAVDDRVIGRRRGRRRGRRVGGRVIGVLVSGEGTNLQALIDAGLPIAAVASNRAGRPGARARRRGGDPDGGVRASAYPDREERDEAMARWLDGHGVELVVCAGYMHLLRPPLLRGLRPAGSSTSHPALLPAVPGRPPDRGRARRGRRPRRARRSTGSTRASTRAP